MQQYIINFLEREHLFQLATVHGQEPRVVTLYYISSKIGELFFLSELETRHSDDILKHPEVAFAISRYDPQNFDNRKGLQGTGVCQMLDRHEHRMHAYCVKFGRNYTIMQEYAQKINLKLKLRKVTPTMMKYRDDELLGEKGSEIITFDIEKLESIIPK